MSKYDNMIRTGDDPVLKEVCAVVQPGEDLAWMDLLERVARKCKRAVGLAAPQIGVAKRGIFLLCRDKNGAIRGERMYNPEIVAESPARSIEEEGCLSYPGIYKAIARPNWVDARYQRHPAEKPITERISGYRARVFLHESDHLNGICRVGDPSYPADVSEPVDAVPLDPSEPLDPIYIRRRPGMLAVAAVIGAALGTSYHRRR